MENEKRVAGDSELCEKNEDNFSERFDKKISSDCSDKSESEKSIPTDIKLLLKNYPEALAFFESLQSCIKKQASKIKKLKSKLKLHAHKIKKKKMQDVSTQTTETTDISNASKTLTEEIAEAAQTALNTNGFVYEATSGMYYDYNTGYYYDDKLRLYYDGNSGIYYNYNPETKIYEYHSQIEIVPNPCAKVKRKKKQKKIQGKKPNVRTNGEGKNEQDLEDGECSDSSIGSVVEISDSDESSSNSVQISDIAKSYPPCMRLLITETTIQSSKPGSLFIITFEGGTLGREGDHSILLPDINISKHHLRFTFDKDKEKYFLIDLGSRNGTLLNGKRISSAKQESEAMEIVHGSVIQVSTTKMLCHIHAGNETCGHCEPGLFQDTKSEAIACESSPILLPSKTSQHKSELKRLKKKFGIEFEQGNVKLAKGYSDRAKSRRDKVGSSVENEKTEVASLDKSISSENKGFKMLSKMGWSEGQSLGKEGTGVKEPVPMKSNPGTSGLGSTSIPTNTAVLDVPSSSNVPSERKQVVWRKTQQRYNQIQPSSLSAFNDTTEDEY